MSFCVGVSLPHTEMTEKKLTFLCHQYFHLSKQANKQKSKKCTLMLDRLALLKQTGLSKWISRAEVDLIQVTFLYTKDSFLSVEYYTISWFRYVLCFAAEYCQLMITACVYMSDSYCQAKPCWYVVINMTCFLKSHHSWTEKITTLPWFITTKSKHWMKYTYISIKMCSTSEETCVLTRNYQESKIKSAIYTQGCIELSKLNIIYKLISLFFAFLFKTLFTLQIYSTMEWNCTKGREIYKENQSKAKQTQTLFKNDTYGSKWLLF